VFADRLATLPLIADPGTKWSYSVGLDLLGRVIEVAGGMPFDQFMQERIFDPLDMKSTWFTVPQAELGRMTTNYFYLQRMPIPVDPGATSIFADKPAFPFGGAGLVSSARDYDRFLAMLLGQGTLGNARLMKPETVKLATSNLLPPGAATAGSMIDGNGFGAGGRVTLRAENGRGAGSFGWGGAAATIAFIDPGAGLRAGGYAQFMPDTTLAYTTEFARSVYATA
jgi:CubicO group peptidase (beta-lactamase class C family)